MGRFAGEGCEPVCRHFGMCGGCMFQHVPYENQLMLKKEYVNTVFKGIASVDSVAGSVPSGYRNRMDMVCAFGKKGLRMPGSYRNVVDIETCSIMQEKCNEIYGLARTALKDIDDYDYLKHEGYLRYIVLRQAKFTGEIMINFVVSCPENRFGNSLDEITAAADSSSLILSDGLADLSYGPVIKTLKKGYITENFDGMDFMITPNSFFQSNSAIARDIYRRIRSCTAGRVLDLYSGVGTISLFVSPSAESVTAVELAGESVEVANSNAGTNEIGNVNFVCADSLDYVRESTERFDTLILDPPRSGMHPKMIKYINSMKPGRIIYMSCNPVTCRDDIKLLEGYSIEFFEAYDMFPQTPHIETLALLTAG